MPAIGWANSGADPVRTRDDDRLGPRLVAIHEGLTRIVERFRPDEAAVEVTFVNKDAGATLKLGQARGIAMLVPARIPACRLPNTDRTW